MIISDSNKRIRELLSDLNITQTEFCKRTHIQKSALSNYLSSVRKPRQDQIMKISEAFNVNPAWVMGFDAPKEWCPNTRQTENATHPCLHDLNFMDYVYKFWNLPPDRKEKIFEQIDLHTMAADAEPSKKGETA